MMAPAKGKKRESSEQFRGPARHSPSVKGVGQAFRKLGRAGL